MSKVLNKTDTTQTESDKAQTESDVDNAEIIRKQAIKDRRIETLKQARERASELRAELRNVTPKKMTAMEKKIETMKNKKEVVEECIKEPIVKPLEQKENVIEEPNSKTNDEKIKKIEPNSKTNDEKIEKIKPNSKTNDEKPNVEEIKEIEKPNDKKIEKPISRKGFEKKDGLYYL